MEKISIGIIGLGTVGQGVLEIFSKHKKAIIDRVGKEVEIDAVCDTDKKKVPKYLLNAYSANWQEIVENPKIDLVVELIGGWEPARTIILSALSSKKNVVTANKAVLARYWDEVFRSVRKHGNLIYFEAAVGGGIPVVQSLNEGLAANKITKISGILNGTTNFILTKMQKEDIGFSTALDYARKYGFAEANPSFDIKGIDTANKLSILTSIAAECWVKTDEINIEGIDGISRQDINISKNEFNYTIKLIGKSIFDNDKIDITVRPTLISESHPFRNVDGEYNAILLHGDVAEDLMFYGKGAGRGPAASAVVSDIIFLSRHIANKTAGLSPYINYNPNKKINIMKSADKEGCYYLRFSVEDRPGVLASIANILAKNRVSIAAVYQNVLPGQSGKGASVVIITHRANEGKLFKSLEVIDRQKYVKGKSAVYPIEN